MATEGLRGSAVLRMGSRDADGKHAVADLQAELRRLQVLQAGEAATTGLFDAATETALRRFQWFAGHVPGALSEDGAFVGREPTRLAVDGVAGQRTQALLQDFAANGWAATGLLVQLDFGRLPHTRPNAGFVALLDGDAQLGLCERDFATVLAAMDADAGRLGLFVFVNQLFRVEGLEVSGTVVPPASFSSHKIGRAVDLQLGTGPTPVTGDNPQPSIAIRNAAAGSAFARFRQHAKRVLRCRYGGEFDPVDAPHFDRQLLPGGASTWQMHYFFDQLQYRQALVNREAIPRSG